MSLLRAENERLQGECYSASLDLDACESAYNACLDGLKHVIDQCNRGLAELNAEETETQCVNFKIGYARSLLEDIKAGVLEDIKDAKRFRKG